MYRWLDSLLKELSTYTRNFSWTGSTLEKKKKGSYSFLGQSCTNVQDAGLGIRDLRTNNHVFLKNLLGFFF